VFQRIISQIPRHRVTVELFGGSAAVTRNMLPAERMIVLDKDPSTVARFRGEVLAVHPTAEYLLADAFQWLSTATIEPDWCIYADPPYHPETLRGEQKYACKFSAGDHLRLLSVLLELPCPVLISGYRHPLYDVALSAWRRIGYWTHDRQNRRRSESLWMNFPAPQILHDPRYVGKDRRQRETRKRRVATFRGRIRRYDAHELQWLAGELDAEMCRRRLEYSAATFGDVAGRVAGSGDGSSSRRRRTNGRPRPEIKDNEVAT
jgi:hypothetical protein